MSIRVEPTSIGEQLAERPYAFVLTTSSERVHVVSLRPEVTGNVLAFGPVGRSTTADVEANPFVTVVWPGSAGTSEYAEYSLIADGRGEIREGRLVVVVDGAVLHRPA